MDKTIRIGAATAFYNDSPLGIAQLLESGDPLDYIIFDFLAESVMGGLGRAAEDGTGPGFATDFIGTYILPHLDTLLDRGIRIIANAGGLNPDGCAQALRDAARQAGHAPRIGAVSGDSLADRRDEFITPGTRDMFDGSSIFEKVTGAERIDSLVAYTGAFPIAAALDAGADIVVAGRAVDSALALGALIHEFGWDAVDFDLLAAGTLAGHLLECSAQVTGGTFTDWQDVPDWANIGMPIAECRADGGFVLTKATNTGGLVTVGTVAEQMLYEVSDPQHYIVADVVADFSNVRLQEVGKDRIELSGARGLGRTGTYKASLTYDSGWRATALIPIIGLEAAAKARRLGDEVFGRVDALLRRSQLPPFERTRCDVVGGTEPGPGTAICRLVADHRDKGGAELLVREQASAISHMSVGISLGLGAGVRPVQHIAGFLVPKEAIELKVTVEGQDVLVCVASDASGDIEAPAMPEPPVASVDDLKEAAPLIRLAWARSGDKGNLFNVAVIARQAEFLPYIAAALTPEAVGEHYARMLGQVRAFAVERYYAPGLCALNFVVKDSMDGGVMASTTLDPVAKGMAQLLLEYPIPVPNDLIPTS